MNHHPVRELLDEYLDGELSRAEQMAVEEHLAVCAHCRAVCEETEQLLARARDLRVEVAPGRDLWPGIAARIAGAAAGSAAAPEGDDREVAEPAPDLVPAPALAPDRVVNAPDRAVIPAREIGGRGVRPAWTGLLAATMALLVVMAGVLSPAGDPADVARTPGEWRPVPARGPGASPVWTATAVVTALEAETRRPPRAATLLTLAAEPADEVWMGEMERGRAEVDEAVAELRAAYLEHSEDAQLAGRLARASALRARLEARAAELVMTM
ncbi:MAG: zf-HC2 domain-containing protein [Candidatus Krumholzibacteriia bacterium]